VAKQQWLFLDSVSCRDDKRNPENRISIIETKSDFTCLTNEIRIFFIFVKKLHKNYQMSGKVNSHICLMLSVYKAFHQMVKYGHQRNQILQDLTEFEI